MLELANININSIVTASNNLAEIINSSQGLSALAIILGISGCSLRDLKGRFNLAKFVKKFKKELPEGTKNEIQENILSNSLVELQDYIKNSENLDDNVFEKIGDIIIYGIKNEDILTREYLRILKKLSWIDVSIFFESYYIIKNKADKYESSLTNNLKYPKEIIRISLEKLNDYKILNVMTPGLNPRARVFETTTLGESLLKLIIGENNYEK